MDSMTHQARKRWLQDASKNGKYRLILLSRDGWEGDSRETRERIKRMLRHATGKAWRVQREHYLASVRDTFSTWPYGGEAGDDRIQGIMSKW